MNQSVTLSRRRADYARALAGKLKEVVARLAKIPEVEQVILFGSYARGQRDLFTDLDLLVVMQSEEDFVQRTARLYQQVCGDVDMDLLVYTPEEFERQQQQGFVRRVLESGKVL